MPPGRESEARAFYEGRLGIPEVAKPADLARRGGCWFEDPPLKVHLGVEEDFRPARKAHPALVVDGLPDLVEALRAAWTPVQEAGRPDGSTRVYAEDPFGNRIELIDVAVRP